MFHRYPALFNLIKWLGFSTGLLIMTACNAAPVTDPGSRLYLPTPGSTVTVPQRIEVPGGQTRIFLQRGEIIKKASQLDLYKTNCNFELNTLAETPRYIEAGTYTITRSSRQEKQVVFFKPLQYAAVGIGGMIGKGSEGPGMYFVEVRMELRSDKPTDIRELACRGVMDDPAWVKPPTLAEIRQALGKHATIKVPEEKN